MKKNPLISIAILNYNGLSYLKETLQAIRNLVYPNKEIIIVDNGSSDGSLEFIKKFKGVNLIQNGKNLGYSEGKNICVEKSNGKYVLLLDNDILIKNKFILNQLVIKYKVSDKICFMALLMKDKGEETTKYYGIYYSFYGINIHKPKLKIRDIISKKDAILVGSFNGGAVFFEKDRWTKIGEYDKMQPIMLDDFDVGARAYIRGYKNYLFNQSEVIHLGKQRDIKKKYFAWKFKYYFSGIATAMIKNYNLTNLIFRLPILFISSIFIMFALSFSKRNLYIFQSFFYSYLFFLINLPKILKNRIRAQLKRVIKEDIFLKIKPPKFK